MFANYCLYTHIIKTVLFSQDLLVEYIIKALEVGLTTSACPLTPNITKLTLVAFPMALQFVAQNINLIVLEYFPVQLITRMYHVPDVIQRTDQL